MQAMKKPPQRLKYSKVTKSLCKSLTGRFRTVTWTKTVVFHFFFTMVFGIQDSGMVDSQVKIHHVAASQLGVCIALHLDLWTSHSFSWRRWHWLFWLWQRDVTAFFPSSPWPLKRSKQNKPQQFQVYSLSDHIFAVKKFHATFTMSQNWNYPFPQCSAYVPIGPW